MPGMKDTNGGSTADLKAVEKLEMALSAECDMEFNNVLLVLNASVRMGDEVKSMVKIIRCFITDDSRIIPCFSRSGEENTKMRKRAETMAKGYMQLFNGLGYNF